MPFPLTPPAPGGRLSLLPHGIALGAALGAGSLWSQSAAPAEELLELAPFAVESHPAGTDERTSSLAVVTPGNDRYAVSDTRNLFFAVPGVHLDQPGGAGGRTTLFLRGSEDNYALVLLDGVPLNDPTNSRGGAVDLSLLSPSAIKQLAVIRGPASVRYGPEALAGVVHFETTLAGARHRELFGAVGGQDFYRAQLDWAQPIGEKLSASLLASTGADGQEADGGEEARRFVRGSAHWEGPVAISVNAWYADLEASRFPDDSGGLRYATIRQLEEHEQQVVGGSLRLTREVGELQISLTADAAAIRNDIVSPGVAPGPRDPAGLPASVEDNVFNRSRAQLLVESSADWGTWSAGLDGQLEDGRSEASFDFGGFEFPADFELDRERFGGFAETTIELPADLALTLGGRLDNFTGEPWRATLRGGLRGQLGPDTTWRFNAGNAFKPPSFYAVAHPLVGNPELGPERSDTFELGLRHAVDPRGTFVEIIAFSMRSRDGIDFDAGPPPMVVNRAEIKTRGAEGRIGWRPLEKLLLLGTLTYVDATVEPEGRLRGRPEWRGGLGAEWQPREPLTLRLTWQAVGERFDSSIATGDVELSAYTRTDASLQWDIHPQLALTLAADNLFNQHYEEAVGFVSRDRRLRLGARASF